MKVNKIILTFFIIFLFFYSCNNTNASNRKALNNNGKKIEQNYKMPFSEIQILANVEKDIITNKIMLNDSVLNKFYHNGYYYVIGKSNFSGSILEKKRAAELDAKRWAAIFMKYILNHIVDLNLEGEHVNFLKYEGEIQDNNGIIYKIYKFRRPE